MLLNRAGRVFVGRRKPKRSNEGDFGRHIWQMPQGGIDRGEEPFAAALRELYEETNVRSVARLAEHPHWLSYDLPVESGRRWGGKYVGQTQKWFALRFVGEESEIDVLHPAAGAHDAEFDDWRWEEPARLPELIVPFKRAVYEQVLLGFAGILAK